VSWFYHFAKIIVRIILLFVTRWQIKGRENIPAKGPLLIVANHLNLADPPLLSVSLNRKTIFMAKEELFRTRFSRYFISGFGAFPVHRGRVDRKALQQAKEVLASGMALVMFPEATRSQDGTLQPAFPGSAMIALQNEVPILPVGILGTENLKGPFWMFRRPRITVKIGDPFSLPSLNGRIPRSRLNEFTNTIMTHIADLLPANQRGIYVKLEE